MPLVFLLKIETLGYGLNNRLLFLILWIGQYLFFFVFFCLFSFCEEKVLDNSKQKYNNLYPINKI